jgi:hypothetical protein
MVWLDEQALVVGAICSQSPKDQKRNVDEGGLVLVDGVADGHD